MIECGPLPGLLTRSFASVSTGTPGCISLRKWDQVSGKLITSPESMVRSGARLACRRRAPLRPRQPREPWLDGGERGHEAAGLQELAAPMATRRQIAVKRLLIDLVHMEKGIGRAMVEGGVLDVLADDARALLVAAAKGIGAGVMVVMMVSVLVPFAVVSRHDALLKS